METLHAIMLALMLLISTSTKSLVSSLESGGIINTLNHDYNTNNIIEKETLSVFKKGNYETSTKTILQKDSSAPPKDLLVVSPTKPGIYPIFLFVHGTMMPNYFYSDLLQHIASHGFIIVAPQIYLELIPPQTEEIEDTVIVANWLDSNLDNILPTQVKGDLHEFTISGHSRGGKTAFALALGKHETQLKLRIRALVAIDPVAGSSKNSRTEPYVLTYKPNSFDLSIPITIIGSGLGNSSTIPFGPSCAPNYVNHVQFYEECKSATHFVLADYGHNDLLNNGILFDFPYGVLARSMCVNSWRPGATMRRSVGGIVVAFLDYAYLLPGRDQFITILSNPRVSPAKLNPVEFKTNKKQAFAYA